MSAPIIVLNLLCPKEYITMAVIKCFPVSADSLNPAVQLVRLILLSDGQPGIAICVKVGLFLVSSAASCYVLASSSQYCVCSRE